MFTSKRLSETLLAVLLMLLLSHPVFSQSNVVDLGTLGGPYSGALDINERGQVVGFSITGTNPRENHAFLWDAGSGMQDLGTLGGTFSVAYDINGKGQVVGWSELDTGITHAFVWSAQGGMQDLGTLGGERSQAYSINNRGEVVGNSVTASGELRGFLWNAATGMQALAKPDDASYVYAWDINDLGHAVGFFGTVDSLDSHALLWTTDGEMQDLGSLGGGSSIAFAINVRGQVVGASRTASGDGHAFLWTAAGMQDLGSLGAVSSEALGINDLGQVVGAVWINSVEDHAFLWTAKSGMQDLNPLDIAVSINNRGQAVGSCRVASGENHACLRP